MPGTRQAGCGRPATLAKELTLCGLYARKRASFGGNAKAMTAAWEPTLLPDGCPKQGRGEAFCLSLSFSNKLVDGGAGAPPKKLPRIRHARRLIRLKLERASAFSSFSGFFRQIEGAAFGRAPLRALRRQMKGRRSSASLSGTSLSSSPGSASCSSASAHITPNSMCRSLKSSSVFASSEYR